MKLEVEHRAKITVERSRFFAFLGPAPNEVALKKLLRAQKQKIKKANHHCWAARISGKDGRISEQARDDGEVGRPGHRLLELLRRHELFGVLIVSRVFGGVKLGPAGVGRAFKRAGEVVLTEAGFF